MTLQVQIDKIFMSFFSGKRGNGLEIGERLDIMTDVAHAVTYLHSYTGISRKPS